MTSFLHKGLNFIGSLFIKLVTRPNILNPQLLLPALGPTQKIYYVLESDRTSHKILLKQLLTAQGREISDQQILLADSGGLAPLRETLINLVCTQESNPELDTLIVPVAIFHGRLPGRENSWLNLLYAETWHKAGPLGSALQLLVNGRATLVKVDPALELKQLLTSTERETTEAVARKTARVIRTHFLITRQSIIGPDLSHRRTLISLVLNDPEVQSAIERQAIETGESRHRIERHSLKALDKIAADFSPVTARLLFPIFNWVWKRLYSKVNIHNSESIQEISKTHQLIYLPCHRSHMDYLLLSWALYQQGLMLPHVAAGENLNIPVIGPILKRCGAIFMRRSFKGDHLYTCLYKSYLKQMSHRGHSLEYFIEGGRSRTGRLLPAKTGLLSMSIDTFREGKHRPVALVPVWLGYDRLVESQSYQNELSGSEKKNESVTDFLSSLSIFRESFGEAHLSFGEILDLKNHTDSTRELHTDVKNIANQVMSSINQASSVTQSSILATALLAGFKRQSVAELSSKCSQLVTLLRDLNFQSGSLPEGKASDWVESAAKRHQLQLKQNQVCLSQSQASEMCFYRNNIQHLFLLPGMYLLLVHRLEKPRAQNINNAIRTLYPFFQSELFLPWSADELTPVLKKTREVLFDNNLLQPSEDDNWILSSNPLAHTLLLSVEPLVLRYYIVLRVLSRYQVISNEDLVLTTKSIAKSLHQEYGYSTPEYRDEKVLQNFIDQLENQDLLNRAGTRLSVNADTSGILKKTENVLRPHLTSLIDQKLVH
ncbi:MAG: glycerol-3-phosphate 1-O-acyltransferase PlsB [Neptuniibacter sp.]